MTHTAPDAPTDLPTLPVWQARSFWLAVATVAIGLLTLTGYKPPFTPDGVADQVMQLIPFVTGALAYRERMNPRRRLTIR